MGYLIDTNIAIHATDGMDLVLDRLVDHADAVALSALSLAELQRGVYRHPDLTALRELRLRLLLTTIPVLPFDAAAAEVYGQIIAQCSWVHSRDFDRMIAAHALATRSVLVTANEAHFRDIPGLTVENWAITP